ncbi:hypothetical protein GCM10010412_094980 [Nonomuraea recticatena]|uniref:Uncharacterized protein n=1 Tax=Nonomuraea recticatena TaxID=46178 RepID=A0ABP6FSB0_9ACTN
MHVTVAGVRAGQGAFGPAGELKRNLIAVLLAHTHVTDQHTTYGTKVIVATKREAHYVLDVSGTRPTFPSPSTRRTPTGHAGPAGRGRYSRILPGTCGRWSPSEIPSVGNWLAISSTVRGPGAVTV